MVKVFNRLIHRHIAKEYYSGKNLNINKDIIFGTSSNYALELLNLPSNIAIVLIGTDEKIIEANTEYAGRFGKTRQEIIGTNAYVNYPEKVARLRRRIYENVRLSGKPFTFIDEREGLWNLHNMYPLKNKSGEVISIAVYGLNITEQRMAEMELEKSEELFHTTVNSLREQVYVIDRDFNLLLVNKECVEQNARIGIKTNIVGKNLFEVYPFLKDKKPDYDNVFKTGKVEVSFGKFDFGDKSYLTETKLIPFFEYDEVTRIVTSVLDVTDIKKTEDELQEALATKDKFFSIVAHDLISPINAACNISEILKNDYNVLDTDKRKTYIKAIHESLLISTNLLENLLTWSRTQRNQISFNPSKINISELIKTSVNYLKHPADNKEIVIEYQTNNGDCIFADPEMIGTVLRNLISNAIKFSKRNNKIIVGYQPAKKGKFEIFVEDNGVGISQENKKRLMKLGEDFSTFGTEKEKGTGLGLILCQEFLKMHKSNLIIWSKEGKGSRISFLMRAYE